MHKHHVIPRYRDSNSKTTVEVTVTQHAMFHFCNWQLWGDHRDWVAWKGLTKEIGEEELFREKRRIGGMVSAGLIPKTPKPTPMPFEERHSLAVAASCTPESRKRQKAAMKSSKHQQGHRNSQYGTMWITNGTQSRKIKKEGSIPDGWKSGRKM